MNIQASQSRHLDRLFHRQIRDVVIRQYGGSIPGHYAVWDANPTSTSMLSGNWDFPTKAAARAWISNWNATDYTTRLRVRD